MDAILQKDLIDLHFLLERVKEEGLDYLNGLQDRPTSVTDTSTGNRNLNPKGIGGAAALEEFKERFEKIIVASSGPRYWGFVTGGTTPAAIMGDWLASVYDQNTQTIKGRGDISGVIEFETITMMRELFGLPEDFFGGFVTGATMSNYTCLATARQWVGKQLGKDVAREGLYALPTIKVLSATPHSSAVKSLSLLGLGSANIVSVKCLPNRREALDLEDLESVLEAHKESPMILISSAGTVNSGDFDDFEGIARLHKKYSFWWHIDGAFGAFAGSTPKYQHLVKGWSSADSITVDCHKWFNVPYENAVYFIKKSHSALQVETFQNSNAPYLGNALENFNYLNMLPENSRRLKALPAWFNLVAYGKNGVAHLVEQNIAQAQSFARKIVDTGFFELMAPVHLNIVPFTVKNAEAQQIDKVLDTVNAGGKVFMTPSVLLGTKGIRAAFVNWRTTEADLDLAVQELTSVVKSIL